MSINVLLKADSSNNSWLNINVNNLEANTATILNAEINELNSDLITLNNQISVPNAPINATSFFSTGQGNLSQTNDLGATVTYATTSLISDAVMSDGNPSVSGNFPQYLDTSGVLVGDSGINVNLFRTLTAGLADLANLTDAVAPAGQSDLWQIPSPGLAQNGGFLNYIESTNTLYSSDWSNAVVGTQYSLDGGITWASCVFDVVPGCAMFISYNGAGLWIAVPNYFANVNYTSIDGINFVSTGIVSGLNLSTNVIYSNVSNLFISGMSTDATHCISTSPDGITWTPRLTPDYSTGLINYTQLAQNSSTIVLVGDCPQVNPSYSLDGGITWILGSGSSFATQAVTWSETKGEFVSMGGSANIIRSSDGILWEDVGAGGFGGTVSVIWVDFPIARYYASYGGAGGFYSMASTIDIHLPFSQTHLDGSIVASQAYGSVIYIQQYDRFLLSVDSSLGIAYSTARPLILKAMNNDMSVYPQYGSKSSGSVITNTVVESQLITGSGVGSLIIPANSMNLGSITKIRFSIFLASLVALSTVVIRLRGNGNQLWQSPVLTGAQVNQVLIGEIELSNVDNANPSISSIFNQDGSLPVLTSTGTALDYTVNDTFTLTAQFSAANPGNQIQLNSINMTLIKF